MPEIARLIGGAGTGKTTELLRLMQAAIDAGGLEPRDVGFVSFTRAARSEAATRAAEKFGCKIDELERDGWFRTLHSVCYRCLQAGADLLTGDKKSHKWIEEALQERVEFADAGEDDVGMGVVAAAPKSDAAMALAIWHRARSMLTGYDEAWQYATRAAASVPTLAKCRAWVERYELHKTIDHRRDFTDLLCQFAGWRCTLDGANAVSPQGQVPALPVWFFDEQQDTSRLLDSVCHRLIGTPECRWVYVVGDPMQAIYGFAGSDASCFLNWDVAKERTMPKSYRCPAPIHELGERILRGCSDYWDRGIAPADHEGRVDRRCSIHELIESVSPRESWLLIARTNFQATRFANILNRCGIPWRPTKGHGGWQAPKRNLGLAALCQLQDGFPIMAAEWKAVIDLIPSKYEADELLVRGTKAKWTASEHRPDRDLSSLSDLADWGATENLRGLIGSGRWVSLVEYADRYVNAVQRWGAGVVEESGVRVGTIHSVKGAEADNVAVLTTTSEPVARSNDTQEGANEERRVAYVAVTRARQRLEIIHEPRERNRMEIEI
jgi:DNA helicase-2/ATP-dependent DNA helicase PcrA